MINKITAIFGRIAVPRMYRCGLLLRTEYRGLSVCLSVCHTSEVVSPAKTAEPFEMSFELSTLVGPGNHILDGGPDFPWEEAIFGKGASHCKV